MRILRITPGQHSALISILATYMRRLQDEPQEFCDCSQDPPEDVTTPELLDLFMNLGGIEARPVDPAAKPGLIAISTFSQLEAVIDEVFNTSGPAKSLALELVNTARSVGHVEALRDIEAKRNLEKMRPASRQTQ